MPNPFDAFVHDENIRLFVQQLKTVRDPAKIAMLKALLMEERARVVLAPDKDRPAPEAD